MANYKKQLTIINRYIKAPNRVNTPLDEKIWYEILEAFRFSDQQKQIFKMFYGIEGRGEMSMPNIAVALCMTEKATFIIYGMIVSKFERYRDDLEIMFENFYFSNVFSTDHLCRKKQKAFLSNIMLCATDEKTKVTLTKAQWDIIFEEASLSKRDRAIVSYNFGIGHKCEYDYKEISEKMSKPLSTSGISTVISKANAKLRKDNVRLLILQFIDNALKK